jgi:hypothetical protein
MSINGWRSRRNLVPEVEKNVSLFIAQQKGDISRKVEKILKENFDHEDLEALKKEYWGVGIRDVLNNVGLEYLRKIYMFSEASLEDIPLHINDGDRFTKGFALWRLKVGK